MTLTPEQIEAGMTRDEAMVLGLRQAAYLCRSVTAGSNDPHYISAGEKAAANCEAAATVIQRAFAEREEAIRQAGVQQGLDMAAGVVAEWAMETWPSNTDGEAEDLIRAIRKLGGDDGTD